MSHEVGVSAIFIIGIYTTLTHYMYRAIPFLMDDLPIFRYIYLVNRPTFVF